MSNGVKTGYIKIVSGGQTVNILSYEQLALSKALRIGATRRNGQVNARAFCCCRADNPPEVFFAEDGQILSTSNVRHTKECTAYKEELAKRIQSSALKAFLSKTEPLPVDFGWMPNSRGKFAILKEDSLCISSSMTFSSWIAFVNSQCFSHRNEPFPLERLKNVRLQVSDVYFEIGSKRLRNIKESNPDKGTILFNEQKIFDHADLGEQDLFYGMITSIWGLGDTEKEVKSKMLHIRCADHRDRRVEFLANKKDFVDIYNQLPFQHDVWICGFIMKKEHQIELPIKGSGLGPIDPTKTSYHVHAEPQKITIKSMKYGRLFNCNNMGMIVFSEEEFQKSNDLLSYGYKLFRPVLTTKQTNSNSIYRYNPDGKDQPILEGSK